MRRRRCDCQAYARPSRAPDRAPTTQALLGKAWAPPNDNGPSRTRSSAPEAHSGGHFSIQVVRPPGGIESGLNPARHSGGPGGIRTHDSRIKRPSLVRSDFEALSRFGEVTLGGHSSAKSPRRHPTLADEGIVARSARVSNPSDGLLSHLPRRVYLNAAVMLDPEDGDAQHIGQRQKIFGISSGSFARSSGFYSRMDHLVVVRC